MSRRTVTDPPAQPSLAAEADASWRAYGPTDYPRILEAALDAFSEHGYHEIGRAHV